MNGATEGDRKIESERKKEKLFRVWAISTPCTRIDTGPCLPLSELKPVFPICYFSDRSRNSSTLHHSATPRFFFLSKKHQRNLELWGRLFNQRRIWTGLCIGPVICIHSIRFIPIRSKPSIHCKTRSLSQTIPLDVFLKFSLSSLINNTLTANFGALWKGCENYCSPRITATVTFQPLSSQFVRAGPKTGSSIVLNSLIRFCYSFAAV